jgi:hypothetical protein
MWSADAACHPDPNVVFTRLGENEGVLLHLNTKRYYNVNETGSRLWELLQEQPQPRRIAAALMDEYLIDAPHALDTVVAFIERLRQAGLVARQAATPHDAEAQ